MKCPNCGESNEKKLIEFFGKVKFCDTCGYFPEKVEECVWEEERGLDTDGVYSTLCGNMFTIMEGNPKENGFKYCAYCGQKILELPEKWKKKNSGR